MTRLATKIVEKPWGNDVLPPHFNVPEGKRIGEVWFVPPPEMPDILVKYIFTSEKLSVQVHPDDAQAKALGESDRGKEECWLVIDAEPDAVLGIGFKREIDSEAMRTAALDGSIEHLLEWFPVKRGDFFYIPAGTVHAIGAGVSLIEIQQNSDITYRLYDHGRPRELHLDKGLQVANGKPHDPALRTTHVLSHSNNLAAGEYFTVDCVLGLPSPSLLERYRDNCLFLPLNGPVVAGGETIRVGQCAQIQNAAEIAFVPDLLGLLVRAVGS